tara:strand:- start:102 stop:338 length:237 start_codon:yes stop_codon:yes gene_type:complete
MGLELSADGKSWVPVKKSVVEAPLKKKQVKIHVTEQPVPGWLKWTVRLIIIGVIIAVIIYAIGLMMVVFLLGSVFGSR